jgi:two-component sensor histidine kinase
MKDLMLAALSRERPHLLAGLAVTMALVLFVLLLEWSFPQTFHRYLPFLPIVLFAALAFGRNAGLLATVLGAVAANLFAFRSYGWLALRWPEAIFIALFIAVGLGLSWLADALSHAVGELRRAESEKALLLDELAHRTRNDLMMVASLLAVQARRTADPQVRAELELAMARVRVIAQLQDRLRNFGKQEQVEVAGYLEALGEGLGQLQQGVRPITVHVSAAPAKLSAPVAMRIGLIVNELVTNAFKYAFPDDRVGTVDVRLECDGARAVLSVHDDGVGCPIDQAGGLGSRLVNLLVSQLGGRLERVPTARGHHVRIVLPIKPDEPARPAIP